jgi:hypothetical protein
LGIGGKWWLELRWLERVGDRVSPKARVLPCRSRMVHDTRSLLFLPLLLEDGFESLLVWTIIRAMVIIFLVENTIQFSFLIVASAPAATPASASASPASAASPLIGVWWTRLVRD